MEHFTEFSQITTPDERNLFFVVVDEKTGESRKKSFEDIYHSVAQIELVTSVPDKIRSQFNIAKNLAVYSWFSYPFHQLSEMKAFSTVEDALKCVLGKHKHGFRGLLKKAVRLGIIKDQGFSHIPTPEDPASIEYSEKLPEIISKLRNGLAHGGATLHPGSIMNLRICSELINQLYEYELNIAVAGGRQKARRPRTDR
jgi:hypothetical protein